MADNEFNQKPIAGKIAKWLCDNGYTLKQSRLILNEVDRLVREAPLKITGKLDDAPLKDVLSEAWSHFFSGK